jgi:hypothetical protein
MELYLKSHICFHLTRSSCCLVSLRVYLLPKESVNQDAATAVSSDSTIPASGVGFGYIAAGLASTVIIGSGSA